MKQVFNPYMPLSEHVPDGEPHVFGDRVYVYGSHDKEGGETFCMLDYVCYSTPVDDLKSWRYEGVIYKASNDPDYNERPFMYAPDVVQGNDGKFYLYYAMSGDYGQGGYFGPIQVAVCDTPAGEYKYLGCVQYPDGRPVHDYVPFDPAVINDNGTIRLYYGTQYDFEEQPDWPNDGYINSMIGMFNKTKEEILSTKDSVMGAISVELEDDMITVKSKPYHIIPYAVKGTSFEGHPFFEGSSIRKFGDTYYFIYSSKQNHELCYATSKYPDKEFTFGGTVVSNGDIGYNGITDETKMNMTGTTHGSIEKINGRYYVFFHRLTHKSDYSRQGCAEEVFIKADGSIDQVEITSCGLNDGPLVAEGTYPAPICCNLTNGKMPHGCNKKYTEHFPHVANAGEVRYINEICDNTLIGFKYFDYKSVKTVSISVAGEAEGTLKVYQDFDKEPVKEINLKLTGGCPYEEAVAEKAFEEISIDADYADGKHGLFFRFYGTGEWAMKEIKFN